MSTCGDLQNYIFGLLERPEVIELMRRSMLDVLIFGEVMPETLDQRAMVLDRLRRQAKIDLALDKA